jgi:hypothetical protein
LLKNPPFLNLIDIDFKSTKRLCGKNIRKLPYDVFERCLLNGERKKRNWLVYSKSKNTLYCFQCLIFGSNKHAFSDPNFRFTNWQKCHHLVNEREKSVAHNSNVRKIVCSMAALGLNPALMVRLYILIHDNTFPLKYELELEIM